MKPDKMVQESKQSHSVRFLIVALLLVLAGCSCSSNPGPSEVGASTVGETEPIETSPIVDGGSQGAGDADEEDDDDLGSLVANYLGYQVPGLGDVDQSTIRVEQEEAIAQCMRNEGFNYIAFVDDPEATYVPVDENIDHESREFATIYGFGVTTQYYSQEDVGPDLIGHSGDGSGVVFTDNPNEAIVNAFGEEEALAYQKAYWGADSPFFTGEVEEGQSGRSFFSSGCVGEGQKIVEGEAGDFLEDFADELAQLQQAVFADKRYIEYTQEVEQCVAEQGYDFYSLGQFFETLAHFDGLMFEVGQLVPGDPFQELDEEALAQLTPRELDALYDAPRDVSEEAKENLADLQSLETDVATAAWDCGGSAAEERSLRDEIMTEIQAEFLVDNADRLASYKN